MTNAFIKFSVLTFIAITLLSSNIFAQNKIIAIDYDSDINGYEVKVFWKPQVEEMGFLIGPAIIEFTNSDKSISFSLTNNRFGLSSGKFQIEYEGNSNLIDSFDKSNYVLSYTGNPIKTVENFESINEPFFFQDVDFDDEVELVITEVGNGQRFRNTFKVYKLDGGDIEQTFYKKITNKEPFISLDTTSEIDYNKKQVTINSSGGACYGSRYIYQYSNTESEYTGNKLILVGLTEYDSSSGKCYEYEYKIIDGTKELISKKEMN